MRLQFGNCELDVDRRLLLVNGEIAHLSPKAFDLLCVLAEARPKAVDKQTLAQRVWPDAFVSDGSLAVLVTEIRTTLKDSAREPQIVRTVPRFGYAFCAVATIADAAAPVVWLLNRTQRIPLHVGTATVGRDPTCEAPIDAQSVSRHHARVRITATEGLAMTVEDLESKNGTFVNDQRIDAATTVRDGDRIRFGAVQFILQLAHSGSTDTFLGSRLVT